MDYVSSGGSRISGRGGDSERPNATRGLGVGGVGPEFFFENLLLKLRILMYSE